MTVFQRGDFRLAPYHSSYTIGRSRREVQNLRLRCPQTEKAARQPTPTGHSSPSFASFFGQDLVRFFRIFSHQGGDNLRSLFRFPPRTKGVAPHYGLAGTFFPGGDLGTDAEERDFKKAKQSIQRTQPSPVPSPSLHRCFGQQYSPQLSCKLLRWPVVTTFFRHTPDSSRLSILRFSPRPHFMGKSTAEDAWQRATTSRMYLLSVHRGVVPSQPSRIGACGRHSG